MKQLLQFDLYCMPVQVVRISNSLGQEVYPATLINQQQQVLSMSTWGGNGLYLLHLINPQGHITEVKKIVLAP